MTAHTSTTSLDGIWQFIHSTHDQLAHDRASTNRASTDRAPTPAQVRAIQVPGPWQAQFADLRMKAGIGLYRREVEVPQGWLDGRRAFLRFGAVFHNTRSG